MKLVMPCASSSGAQAGAPATTRIALPPSRLLDFGSGLGIVVVAGADHDDLGFRLQRGFHALLDRLEVGVVDHLDAGACEEVARELRAGAGHAQIAARQHECLRLLAAAIDMQAHLLERHGAAVGNEHVALGLLARNGLGGDLLAGDLRKVGILVGAEQYLAARCDVLVLGCGRRFDALGDEACLVGFGVAALLLDFEEEPSTPRRRSTA